MCSRLPTLIDLACPVSPNLNDSNRPVRTRMPGGVAGDRSVTLAAPMPIAPGMVNSSGCKKGSLQVLQQLIDATSSQHSHEFRPGRRLRDAVQFGSLSFIAVGKIVLKNKIGKFLLLLAAIVVGVTFFSGVIILVFQMLRT